MRLYLITLLASLALFVAGAYVVVDAQRAKIAAQHRATAESLVPCDTDTDCMAKNGGDGSPE